MLEFCLFLLLMLLRPRGQRQIFALHSGMRRAGPMLEQRSSLLAGLRPCASRSVLLSWCWGSQTFSDCNSCTLISARRLAVSVASSSGERPTGLLLISSRRMSVTCPAVDSPSGTMAGTHLSPCKLRFEPLLIAGGLARFSSSESLIPCVDHGSAEVVCEVKVPRGLAGQNDQRSSG